MPHYLLYDDVLVSDYSDDEKANLPTAGAPAPLPSQVAISLIVHPASIIRAGHTAGPKRPPFIIDVEDDIRWLMAVDGKSVWVGQEFPSSTDDERARALQERTDRTALWQRLLLVMVNNRPYYPNLPEGLPIVLWCSLEQSEELEKLRFSSRGIRSL